VVILFLWVGKGSSKDGMTLLNALRMLKLHLSMLQLATPAGV
jgi:hypothetical protein